MCEFKTEEHKMTVADVRHIARSVVWDNALSNLDDDAAGVVSVKLANDKYASFTDDRMYWQPDVSYEYADRHLVTGAQFVRIVDEVNRIVAGINKQYRLIGQ